MRPGSSSEGSRAEGGGPPISCAEDAVRGTWDTLRHTVLRSADCGRPSDCCHISCAALPSLPCVLLRKHCVRAVYFATEKSSIAHRDRYGTVWCGRQAEMDMRQVEMREQVTRKQSKRYQHPCRQKRYWPATIQPLRSLRSLSHATSWPARASSIIARSFGDLRGAAIRMT